MSISTEFSVTGPHDGGAPSKFKQPSTSGLGSSDSGAEPAPGSRPVFQTEPEPELKLMKWSAPNQLLFFFRSVYISCSHPIETRVEISLTQINL